MHTYLYACVHTAAYIPTGMHTYMRAATYVHATAYIPTYIPTYVHIYKTDLLLTK